MKKIEGWDEIKASGEGNRLPAGGYVAKIMSAEDDTGKQYLRIELDIAEGKDANYYTELAQRAGFWGLTMFRSYKPSAAGFFKGFINDVEKSNPGYKWNWDESTLEGLRIGVILREEEYVGMDGSVKTHLKPYKTMAADKIREGKFKVPEIKKLPEEEKNPKPQTTDSFEQIDKDVPF
jgi:hypothetical protein